MAIVRTLVIYIQLKYFNCYLTYVKTHHLVSWKLALSSFKGDLILRSSMLVYILILKVLNRRTLIKSLKPEKSQNLKILKNFNTGICEHLQKL